ncbi:acyl-CoA dehydrogenase family protein [Rhodococcoides fascians]|uniref:acyl-CoA dehydrogenase family protein n=1 Tax=Rhodococcoides fascians TaxID=1828 RepID=UPI00050C61C5|nr:acyl-CoA dehydrogenase family protein [Rhodococcus fascians]
MKVQLVPPLVGLPPESDSLRTEVRAFLQDQIAAGKFIPQVDSWIAGWDAGFSRALGEQGWLGMTIPAMYGGGGRSHLDRYVVTEELLAAGAPVAAHWVADRQVGPALMRHGSEYQRTRYLPGIARGETFFAIGMSEPESGSDLASVRTRATQVDGGWEVTGTKVWTSGAHHAHAFFVLARSEELDPSHRHAGLSQFIVDLDSPGIEIRPIKLLTGHHHFNEVVLNHVFVPDDLVLGKPGDGWNQVTSELGVERSGPERIFSSFPLLDAFAASLFEADTPAEGGVELLGDLFGRAHTLRHMSVSVAGSLATGGAVDLPAAMVKDLGTQFEQEVVESISGLSTAHADPDSTDRLSRALAEGLLHSPGFTLRGGTSEVLKGVVSRGLGLR